MRYYKPRYRYRMYEKMLGRNVDSLSELYNEYYTQYPYATDAVAYYFFNDTDADNLFYELFSTQNRWRFDKDSVNQFMKDFESDWFKYMKYIDNELRYISVKNPKGSEYSLYMIV